MNDMVAPVFNPVVTSHYGPRVLAGKPDFHRGIDYVDGTNDRRVRAVADGVVVLDFDSYDDAKRWIDPVHSAGNYICVQHTIEGQTYFARYLHLLKNTVTKLEKVSMGAVLGEYADVGFSYGAHVHFEIFNSAWQIVDPSEILRARGIPV